MNPTEINPNVNNSNNLNMHLRSVGGKLWRKENNLRVYYVEFSGIYSVCITLFFYSYL